MSYSNYTYIIKTKSLKLKIMLKCISLIINILYYIIKYNNNFVVICNYKNIIYIFIWKFRDKLQFYVTIM